MFFMIFIGWLEKNLLLILVLGLEMEKFYIIMEKIQSLCAIWMEVENCAGITLLPPKCFLNSLPRTNSRSTNFQSIVYTQKIYLYTYFWQECKSVCSRLIVKNLTHPHFASKIKYNLYFGQAVAEYKILQNSNLFRHTNLQMSQDDKNIEPNYKHCLKCSDNSSLT